MRLAAEPNAPQQARRYARQWAHDERLADPIVDDLVFVVSELVTNAVVHAEPPIDVELSRSPGVIRGRVSDASPVAPRLASRPDEHGGFGLRIVDSRAKRWGSVREDDGKYVWFEITSP